MLTTSDKYTIQCPYLTTESLSRPAGMNLPTGLACVTYKAPRPLRTAVYRIATYFRREFEFDFVQFGVDDEDTLYHAYIWLGERTLWLGGEDRAPVLGACCFRYRSGKRGNNWWGLQWIWLHPYERRQGHLSAVWPYFCDQFPNFVVEGPLSEAMMAFLGKVNPLTKVNPLANRQNGDILQCHPEMNEVTADGR